jgi:hypothetical protein
MKAHKAKLRADAERRNAAYQAARKPPAPAAPVLTPDHEPGPTMETVPATKPPRQRTRRDTETRKRRPYRQPPVPDSGKADG